MSLCFQLWSDLHLETCDLTLPTEYRALAPYLLLAGDIGVPGGATYRALLDKVASAHELVFVTTGNHEYYGSSIQHTDETMQSMCRVAGANVVFLNNAAYDIPGLPWRIVGTTLWSHVQSHQKLDVACLVSDHRLIDGWGIGHNNARHALGVAFIRSEIARAKADGVRLVVMTHHAPLIHGVCHPRHDGSQLSSAFQTDLTDLMGPPVSSWCFGHTHHCSSQVVNGTHVVSNQRGFGGSPQEVAEFRPDTVFWA